MKQRDFWIYKNGTGTEDIEYMSMRPTAHLEEFLHVREVSLEYDTAVLKLIEAIVNTQDVLRGAIAQFNMVVKP